MTSEKTKPRINHQFYSQTRQDSAAITMLGTVVHPVPVEGIYEAAVLLKGRAVAHFVLHVHPQSSETQVNIDLESLTQSSWPTDCACHDHPTSYAIKPGGYMVLYVSKGIGGFAVIMGLRGEQEKVSFDSRTLTPGDYFAIALVRPGRYASINRLAGGKLEFAVAPVKPDKHRYVPPAPREIACRRDEMTMQSGDETPIYAAQGIVFAIHEQARIVVEYLDPIPERSRPGPMRWDRPLKSRE